MDEGAETADGSMEVRILQRQGCWILDVGFDT
jgi:hypothetical protein